MRILQIAKCVLVRGRLNLYLYEHLPLQLGKATETPKGVCREFCFGLIKIVVTIILLAKLHKKASSCVTKSLKKY